MNQQKRKYILERLHRNNPHPATTLIYASHFELLISVLLSAQTTDNKVNKATARLYQVANTPSDFLALGIEGIKEYIKILGLYNRKAKNIIKTCRILLDKYNGIIPENRAALESLPGVGRKTANVVLNTAFHWPTIAVDTHVFRICNRTGFAPAENVFAVENKLLKLVPKKFQDNCHNLLVMHGRYTCVARKPHCNACVIEDLCEFKKKFFYIII
ncbi:endonuclease III [Candidatus Profftia tarda]|nr:endonuclease III [Candidatus Profftia tarda]